MKPLAFLVLALTAIASSSAQTTAQTPVLRHENPTGAILRGINANSAGLLVAVGDNGRVLTSANGTTWTARDSGVPDNFTAVTFAGGIFVAPTDRGRILTSADGISWAVVYSGNAPLNAAEGFSVVGDFGTLLQSNDGRNWTRIPLARTSSLRAIVFPYIAGDGGTWLEHDRVSTWQPVTVDTDEDFTAVAYSGAYREVGHAGSGRSSSTALGITRNGAYLVVHDYDFLLSNPATWRTITTSRPGTRPIRCLVSSDFDSVTTVPPSVIQPTTTSTFARRWLAIDDAGMVFLGRDWQPLVTLNRPGYAAVWSSGRSSWFIAGASESIYQIDFSPPLSTTSLARQAVTAGQSLALDVSSRFRVLSYQWYRNGVLIPGATNSRFTIDGVSLTRDAGRYQAIVSTEYGGFRGPVLFVNVAPKVTQVAGWGNFGNGQLDTPGGNPYAVPPDLGNVVSLAAGWYHTLALRSDGTVVAWGDNTFGQRTVPAGLGNVVAIAAGGHHSLALKADGTVVCWGRNTNGQSTPPDGLADVVEIAGGRNFSLALHSDGRVSTWGNSPLEQRAVPASAVATISAGSRHAVALDDQGRAFGWGDNRAGQAIAVSGTYYRAAAGDTHTLALHSFDGSLEGWGSDDSRQISGGSGLAHVIGIAVGDRHSVALKADGTVAAWGNNEYGQATVPAGLANVVQIAARGAYTVVLRDLVTPPVAPVVTVPPTAAQTLVAGESTTLAVTPSGTGPFSYQWKKDNVPIPGATAATFTLNAAQLGDAGSYTVMVSSPFGAVTSTPSTLMVKSANPGRFANFSIRTATGAGNATLIVGFALGGADTAGATTVLTRASGPALRQFGVANALADPVLSLFDGVRSVAQNDNWGGDDLATSAAQVGAFAFSPASRDAALSSTLPRASYTAQVTDLAGASGVALLEVYDTSGTFSYARPRLVNLSARAPVASGESAMIAGFVVKGETPTTVLLRAIGPTLAQFGVTGTLANPQLILRRDSTVVAFNDNWPDTNAAAIASAAASVGAFTLSATSLDSAILTTLQPGAYTVELSSPNGTTGIALLELYDVP